MTQSETAHPISSTLNENEPRSLANEKCATNYSNQNSLNIDEIQNLLKYLDQWHLNQSSEVFRLEKQFQFNNFNLGLKFANKIGAIADLENHHPTIQVEWGKVTVYWWTHAVEGLHKNDFICAAKTDDCYQRLCD